MTLVEVYDKFAKPAKPVVQSKSLTSVTLKAVAGALYSKDGTNWTESNEFTGLTENTEYSFYIKLKADGYYHESDASDAALVKTDESTILVTGMELDKSSLELMVNDTAKLTAIVEPDRPSAPEMNWISTNTSVAAVDNSGNITAKAIGLTFIMCKSTDGSDKTAICAVKVYDQYDAPETIEVDAVTGNRIAIKAVNGCEYRIGTGNWSDSAEFTGLETNTEYEIGVRRAANGYHKASEVKTIKLKTLDPVNDQEKTDADSAESGKPSKQDTTEDGTSSGQAVGTTEQAAAEAGSILQDTQGIRYKVILITDAKSTVAYEKPAAGTSGTVVIPDEVTIDGITYKVTNIAEGAFRNNKQITKVVIGKNVKGIGEKAFYGCTKLKTVSMGKQVESFGNQAFARCTSLTKFTVPASVKKLGKKVWSGCTKLKTLTVKSTALTAKTVSKNAFGGISAKTTAKVPKKMKKKYEELFRKKGLAKKAGIRS